MEGSVKCPRLGIGVNTARTKVSMNRSKTARRYLRSLSLVERVPNVIMVGPSSSIRTETTMGTTCSRINPMCLEFNELTIPMVGSAPSCGFRVKGNVMLKRNGSMSVFTAKLRMSRALRTTGVLTTSNVSTRIVGVRAVGPVSERLVIGSMSGANGTIAMRRRSVGKKLKDTITRMLYRRRPTGLLHVNMRSHFNRSKPTIRLVRGCKLSTRNVCGGMGGCVG